MALSSDQGIFLIQGPPGTGKTATLQLLLGAHFAAHPRKRTPLMQDDGPNTHAILLCASTNAAVDEMLRRVSKMGIYTKTGKKLEVCCGGRGQCEDMTTYLFSVLPPSCGCCD